MKCTLSMDTVWYSLNLVSDASPIVFCAASFRTRTAFHRLYLYFSFFSLIKRHKICRWQVIQQQITYDSGCTKTEKQEKHNESKVTRESYKQLAKANWKVMSKCELSRWQTNRQIEWHELRVTTQNFHSHVIRKKPWRRQSKTSERIAIL